MKSSVTPDDALADAEVVVAIRDGDRERYRELVERYADKVFAVAWCRLGDRSLAEEAAQEAFIAGFRRLRMLTRADKFGAWITTIARRTAINLGLRHRGDLQRRERWALESESPNTDLPADSEADPESTSQTLRDVLETLPPTHRECLVLFYLENRSIAEAAGVLGVSEGAFKVRLHRARGVLREALESRLEKGLGQLRAPSRLAAAVMLALPTRSGGLAVAGGLWTALAKFVPFGAALFLLQIVMLVPGLVLVRWIGEKEIANLRDPHGVRAQEMRRRLRRSLIFTPLVMIGGLGLIAAVRWLGSNFGWNGWRGEIQYLRGLILLLAVFIGFTAAIQLRRLRYVRHRSAVLMAAASLLMTAPILGVGLFDWPTPVLFVGQGFFLLLLAFARPMETSAAQASLFQRAQMGSLPEPPATAALAATGSTITSANEFGRYLGTRFLLVDGHREGPSLRLALIPVRTRWNDAFLLRPDRHGSFLILHPTGSVEATLGIRDRKDLAQTAAGPIPSAPELEALVAAAVRNAWRLFDAKSESAAAQCLGEVKEEAIYRVAPARSSAHRLRVAVSCVMACFCMAFPVYELGFRPSPELSQARQRRPVSVGTDEVRRFLEALVPGATNHAASVREWNFAAQVARELPGPDRFPADALAFVRSNALNRVLASSSPHLDVTHRVSLALGDGTFLNQALAGIVTDEDLRDLGLDPRGLRAGIRGLGRFDRDRLFGVTEYPFVANGDPCSLILITDLARRARFLARHRCLEPQDFEAAVEPLVSAQILPKNGLTNRWTARFRKETTGLFTTGQGEFLLETRDALTILNAAGALDRIDRKACIDGILRWHRGKGLFAPRRNAAGGQLNGKAEDTFAAFESLQILGALDRIPDLAQWEFRPPFPDPYPDRKPEGPALASEHLQAFALREAFRSSRQR